MTSLIYHNVDAPTVILQHLTDDYRLFKNPYFIVEDCFEKLYGALTIEGEIVDLLHLVCPILTYTKTPMSPKFLRGDRWIAASCEYFTSPGDTLIVLKDPQVVEVLGRKEVPFEGIPVKPNVWDWAIDDQDGLTLINNNMYLRHI